VEHWFDGIEQDLTLLVVFAPSRASEVIVEVQGFGN
jgi:hypothetical protein